MKSLKSILTRSAETMEEIKLNRLMRAGLKASDNYVANLIEQRDQLEEEIESIMDFNKEMDLTAKEVKYRVTTYHDLMEKHAILTRRINVAEEVSKILNG